MKPSIDLSIDLAKCMWSVRFCKYPSPLSFSLSFHATDRLFLSNIWVLNITTGRCGVRVCDETELPSIWSANDLLLVEQANHDNLKQGKSLCLNEIILNSRRKRILHQIIWCLYFPICLVTLININYTGILDNIEHANSMQLGDNFMQGVYCAPNNSKHCYILMDTGHTMPNMNNCESLME